MDFRDSKVLVTGGSRGIGESIAAHFASAGARVAVAGRDLDRAEQACARMDGDARPFSLDVGSPESVENSFGAIVDDLEGLDVLVNNAGITRDKLVMALRDEDWEDVIATNLRGTFLCSRAALRPMLRQRSGRIINITSVVGLTGNPGQGNYAASKAGIIGFTKSLAQEVASRSITVNAIAPGMIVTEMTGVLDDEQKAAIKRKIPMGRMGDTAEVAQVALFLASPAATYITGEVIRVDGGLAC
ncbi:MAG TPA: 3-oxoacyl-[acyl-carrier-protein] reductase [Planctomycetes bacterium]|nr:3-oxoacyl-[acyl-carrier-protein] reductase [Planctomycetota bacterium]HIN80385.1 3-oxoacyl-[acyl-carrier-protein] reductase [Planctomycetota bacterium]